MINPNQVAQLSRADQLKLLKVLAARFPADPNGYISDFLGKTLTPQQQHINTCLLTPPYRVLIRSANNQGKTFNLACIANWWYDTFRPGVMLATAPSSRQVRDLLFKEIRTMRPTSDGLSPKACRIEDAPNHFAHGFTARDEDGFKGQHEGNLLMIFDEAVGVDRGFWTAAETMFTGEPGCGWLAAYNPTDVTSFAYAAEASDLWHVVHLNALEHPNIIAELRGEPPPIPSAIRLKRVLQRIAKECEFCGATKADDSCFEFPAGSNRWYKPLTIDFEVQILGRWPSSSFDGVWSKMILEQCNRPFAVNDQHPVQIGCDVARFGRDLTGFAVRKGLGLIHLEVHAQWTTAQIANRLRELCYLYRGKQDPKRIPCLIDDTGGYGSGVIDYPEGFNFLGINSSESAREPNKYPNVRTELWFTARSAADVGAFNLGSLRAGHELMKQLNDDLLSTKYSLDRANRRQVESKKHTKSRSGRSPDLGDAVNLAWYPCV
jgi:phage terminase large subunit